MTALRSETMRPIREYLSPIPMTLTLSNLNIHNVNWEGIQVGSSSSVVIDSVQVYNSVSSLQNESITLKATTNFEIKNSSIHDNKKEGINCKNGSSNGLIHDNDIYNIPSDGIYLETTGIAQSNISIYRNRIHTGAGNGIALGSELDPVVPRKRASASTTISSTATAGGLWPIP